MQLSPGERSILAYFSIENAAREAVEKLKDSGYSDVQLDTIPMVTDTVSAFGTSLPSISMTGDDIQRYIYSPQLPIDPVASRISSEVETANHPYIVTVISENDHIQTAVDILKSSGARV